jgi:hypothetical protein
MDKVNPSLDPSAESNASKKLALLEQRLQEASGAHISLQRDMETLKKENLEMAKEFQALNDYSNNLEEHLKQMNAAVCPKCETPFMSE